MKELLIIGGTSFVGRNIAEFFINNQYFETTLFNRGITNSQLFKGTKRLYGDRNNEEDLNILFQHEWDVIIDVSCYFPNQLRPILKNVNKNVQYVFISTCSVYNHIDHKEICRDETSPTFLCSAENEVDQTASTYGNRKAECERILKKSGITYTIFRPALVYGAYDLTDRLYYWLYQTKKNDKLLFPENGIRRFSMTYINDLVHSVFSVIQNEIKNETFNCISQVETSIDEIVTQSEQHYKRNIERINAPASFLKDREVSEWTDMPLWLNTDDFTFSNKKIQRLLNIKPTSLGISLSKTINYFDSQGYSTPKYGMSDELKNQLIHELESCK